MTCISDFMTNHHRECDRLFAVAEESVANKNWTKAQTEFAHYARVLAQHLKMEEEVLFPAFDDKTAMQGGPTQVMRSEHTHMRQLVEDMQQCFVTKQADRFLGLAETLMVLTQQHNMKEEQMLYHMMDRIFGAEAQPLLAHASACI